MHRSTLRCVAAVCALVLTPLIAGCGPETITPLAAQPSEPATAAPASATPVAGSGSATARATPAPPRAAPKPTKVRTTRPTPTGTTPSSCRGAERYDLDLDTTELALVTSMCFAVGGVLRLQGIGPGLVTAEPTSLVSQQYEAGVVDIRFLHPGTVTVRVPQDEQVYPIDVVIID